MGHLAIQKQNTSVKLSIDTKQALERFAKEENRSVHYLLVTAIEEFVAKKQEEAEYHEYIKNRVLATEKRFHEQGADNLTKEQVKNNVRQFLDNRHK